MSVRRRNPGFRPIGRVDPNSLDLPAQRARALMLEHAWRRVAGPAVARQAPAVRIARGTLEIRVSDERWAAALKDLLPRLAARLSRSFPRLQVRRFRLLRQEDGVARAMPLPELTDEAPVPQRTVSKAEVAKADPVEDASQRLDRVMERYVSRRETGRDDADQKP